MTTENMAEKNVAAASVPGGTEFAATAPESAEAAAEDAASAPVTAPDAPERRVIAVIDGNSLMHRAR